jgi:hypothetical protein
MARIVADGSASRDIRGEQLFASESGNIDMMVLTQFYHAVIL